MYDITDSQNAEWSWRPWVLASLLGVAGLLVHVASDWNYNEIVPWRAALAGFFFFAPLALAFTLEREDWKAPLVFSAVVGLVMAGIAWRVASAQDHYADERYWLAAAIVSITLALPLFQAGFHKMRWQTSYEATHYHVWTDAICAAGALAFTGLSWLLALLLSELFRAIGIDFLRDLLNEESFGWLFSGIAFGAALGVLRNQLKVIGTLQSVVMLVFSLVAVPFAIALVIFILAVLPSGLEGLWSATRSPTPLLLCCAAASFVLVNAVVRNNDAEASDNRLLRWTALVLALAILPLALMATVSTGTRIAEYGLSPERIWGLIAIVVAVAYGVAYFFAPIRGRMAHWMERVRTANLHLAVGTCVIAFVLALPIFDFGAISARDQVARLQSGQVTVDEFDFDALRWDFGDAGREALAELASSPDDAVAKLAAEARDREMRPWHADDVAVLEETLTSEFVVYPAGADMPEGLRETLGSNYICRGDVVCRIYLQPDGIHAVVLSDGCASEEGADPDYRCSVEVEPYALIEGKWKVLRGKSDRAGMTEAEERAALLEERRAIENGDVTIGPSQIREIYVGDKPSGRRFE